jgi:Skp family chaperone for outer membrane proteins
MTTTGQIATGLLASAERVTAALVAASERNADDIGQVGILLVDTLSARIEAFFRELDDIFVVTAEQNQQLELELEARVDTLVARTDEAVTRLSQRLGEQADRLIARDDHLEDTRAEAFTQVLEGLLSRVGGQRALRKRVREMVALDPEPTLEPPAPVPSAPAAPEPVAVRPAVPTVVEALPARPVRATAPAKKTPAKAIAPKTPAKKAPAKKTLAKKAAPTPRTTRTKEDSS